MQKGIQAVSVKETAGAEKMWQEVVDSSPDAWLWHTRIGFEFNLCAGQKYAAEDHSFFICKDGEPVGVAPLIVEDARDGSGKKEARYYSGFTPWPCFRKEIQGEELMALEDAAFAETEKRIAALGVARMRAQLVPPKDRGNERERVERIAKKYGYAVVPVDLHLVDVGERTLDNVRERYRRYYKKFSPLFDLAVVEGAAVTPVVEETYLALHVKDAGGQFRSRESYAKQADTARGGEGFYVVATEKATGKVAGMLLISLYHGAALDNSTAVDPDYQHMRVSNLMKTRVIEELQSRGITSYVLGDKVGPDATEKEKGISLFKDGYARGNFRTVYALEKVMQ